MPDFTITFICHSDLELTEKTIEQNILSLCQNTKISYDLVLVVDNCKSNEKKKFFDIFEKFNFSEIRFRSRKINVARGDPSNNGHYYAFTVNTPYQITIESDVLILKEADNETDVLQYIKETFEKYQDVSVAFKINDYDCWAEPLFFYDDFEQGIQNASRVSSHFLIYNTRRVFNRFVETHKSIDMFFDTDSTWFNYEDYIGKIFRKSDTEAGIAYIMKLPIKVFHCDEKIRYGSPFYTKDLQKKLKIYERIINDER